MPGGGTGTGPPGGARGRGQAPRSPCPRRPCVGSPRPAPAPRAPIQVRAAGAAGSARPGPVHLAQAWGSRVDPRVPGAEQSPRQVPGLCPPRAPAGVGGPDGEGERPPPRLAAAAAARELCRRLAPAGSSCSSFPGNFRPGIASPAQPAAPAPPLGVRAPGAPGDTNRALAAGAGAAGLCAQVRSPRRTSLPGFGGCGVRGGPCCRGRMTSPPVFGGCGPAACLPRVCAQTLHGMGGRARGHGQCFRGAGGVRRGRGLCW